MIVIESGHVKIHNACDVELERLVDHIKRNPALNLARIVEESLLIDIGCQKAIFKFWCDRKLHVVLWLTQPLDRLIEFLFRFT